MKIRAYLEHPKTGHKTHFDLHCIDAGGLTRVIQDHGQAGVNGLVSRLVLDKCPTELYTYDVVEWDITDEGLQVAA